METTKLPNPVYRLPPWTCTAVAKTYDQTKDWSLDFLKIPEVWKMAKGTGVKVCILDTGVDLTHPDLKVADVKDFSNSVFGADDRNAHGTWTLGMVAGAQDNEFGVVSIAPEATAYAGKVLGDDGTGSDQAIRAGLEWADEIGADVVSMSLGAPTMGPNMKAGLIEYLSKPGRFVIAAAGNAGMLNSVGQPAKDSSTLAVAAVDRTGHRAPFSSRGPEVDVAAPGVDMISTVPTWMGLYGKMSGTSMATPVVAGVVALMISSGFYPDLKDISKLRSLIRQHSTDVGPVGRDDQYGFGLINPSSLLEPTAKPGDGGSDQNVYKVELMSLGFATVYLSLELNL